jgi:hypothetical protein
MWYESKISEVLIQMSENIHWHFIEGLQLLLQPRKQEQKFWLWTGSNNKIKVHKKVYFIWGTKYSI